MYQSDWILRQIEMLGVMFKRMVNALREHRPDEVLEVSRDAAGELLETDADLIDVLTGNGLVALLSAGGSLDVFRAHMLGELLAARVEALEDLGRPVEAARERDRALALLRAALPSAEDEEADRVGEVIGWLEEGAAPGR